ncbi:hypothetical protein GVN16_10320 [Emticicia sp. CRIBPO]|uniref:DUF5004 domain-containing protein n=1 Tax=Emticicia sp. CRIBPO TaxID=2683258 RepID=UPI0014126C30|nr:DUF5004 domain-containing protein [Emticicia sp. CRIBPO]NBA86157.1 hypothetical protein [Emticicia sp. CRIBPO]
MKKSLSLFCITLAFINLFVFTSCEVGDVTPKQLEGSWKMVSAESNVEIKGQKPEKETVDVSKAELVFNFRPDGTFTYSSALTVGEIAVENKTQTTGKFRIEGEQAVLEFYDAEMDKKAEMSFMIYGLSGNNLTLFFNKDNFGKALDQISGNVDAFSRALIQTFKDNIIRYDLTYKFERI